MRFTPVEARWRDALLPAVLPVGGLWPVPATVWAELDAAATPLMRWGFRFAVWWLTWTPLLREGRPLHRLSPEARQRVLDRVGQADGFVVRQVVLVTKAIAALTAYRDAP